MSRRTSFSNRAIREAWKNEKSLVQRGQGTRNWTTAQQRDILERGKAYDENGKAFEGHHMKSAEAYPEYQGDPDNIQFLSREEHQDAHFGDFKNPTNGYYDPETRETLDFGEDKYEPCEVVDLSESVVKNVEQEEKASDLAEGIDKAPSEENSGQEEQASDLSEGTEEAPAEESSEQEEQASDLTEGADESLTEDNTEQEEQTSELAEDVDTESTQKNGNFDEYSEGNESDESQSYGY